MKPLTAIWRGHSNTIAFRRSLNTTWQHQYYQADYGRAWLRVWCRLLLCVIATCIRAHSPASAPIADQWALLFSSEVNSTTSIMARTPTSIYWLSPITTTYLQLYTHFPYTKITCFSVYYCCHAAITPSYRSCLLLQTDKASCITTARHVPSPLQHNQYRSHVQQLSLRFLCD